MDKMTLDAGDSCVGRTRDLHDVLSFAKAADKAAHGGHMEIIRLLSAACYKALPDWSSVALCEYLDWGYTAPVGDERMVTLLSDTIQSLSHTCRAVSTAAGEVKDIEIPMSMVISFMPEVAQDGDDDDPTIIEMFLDEIERIQPERAAHDYSNARRECTHP